MIEAIGWLSALCFMLSGIPFAYKAYKDQRVDAPWTGILLILFGSAGMFVYEACTAGSMSQLADFFVCSACWATVAYVKLNQGGI